MRVPFGVPVVTGVLALGLAGCSEKAFAQTQSVGSFPSPPPELRLQASSLPVLRPLVAAEAGVLPTSILAFFDRLDEFFERNLFSFGIPGLRARVALAQAAERIAELQALERNGQLTPRRVKDIVSAHDRLLLIPQGVVTRQIEAGKVPAGLVFHLARTELSAADALEELLDELEVEIVLEAPTTTPRTGREEAEKEEGEEPPREFEDIADLLTGAMEDLLDFESNVLTKEALPQESQEHPPVPGEILSILAEQKIAKAERDLFTALAKVEERLAHGKVLIADEELRAGAESSLRTARQLFTAGNHEEAISFARQAHRFVSVLKSGKIALEPNALLSPRGEKKAEDSIRDLVKKGLLSAEEQVVAVARARAVVERVQGGPGVPPRRERANDGEDTAERREQRRGRRDGEKERGESKEDERASNSSGPQSSSSSERRRD